MSGIVSNDPFMAAGASVEVRRRFDDRWARGFRVAKVMDQGYVLRRVSDDAILPAVFAADDLRPARSAPPS
jgi:hypothetical protein